jgi:HK97 family phage major capsid protein
MNETDILKAVEQTASQMAKAYGDLDAKTEAIAKSLDALKNAKSERDATAAQSEIVSLEKQIASLTEAAQSADKSFQDVQKALLSGAGSKPPARQSVSEFLTKSIIEPFAAHDGAAKVTKQITIPDGMIRKAVLTSASGVGAGNLGELVRPERSDEFLALPRRNLVIADLIPALPTSSNAIEYVRHSARTSRAAPVAETTLKPESDFDVELITTAVRTMAHTFRGSRQILDDAPGLQALIESEGVYMLDLLRDSQLLLGDGTGQNLTGLIPSATAWAHTLGGINIGTVVAAADVTIIDRIRWAKLQARRSLFPADYVVMSPDLWTQVEMLKDADKRYIYSQIGSGAEPRLWGLRVVESDAIGANQFLLGSSLASERRVRMGTEVLVSTEDRDNFVANMVTFRIEGREAHAIKRPAALVVGTTANPLS